MALDKDLQSIQETRDLLARAKQAQLAFKSFDQKKVDAVVKAMADAGFAAAERLAKQAHEETGFGKPADKKKKNEFATKRVWESIKELPTVGVIHEDKEKRIIEIAEPMGVVAALIPSTNPTSTMMFKAIISLKGRNAIVASPHPRAVHSTLEAARVISQAAEKAGAPPGLINCISIPTTEGTNELMRHKLTAVILATGSNPMVKAAYSSGKPAYGVGSGNVPTFVERTANVRKAVADIVSGKMFDWGVLCSTESGVILDEPIKKLAIEEFRKRGAYIVSDDERDRLSKLMFDKRGAINPEIVGKSPTFIAQKAGFDVPHDTTCLIAELPGIGPEYPLSREKLSPVLSMFTVRGWREGCEKCIEMLQFGGIGHSMVIHCTDPEIILQFGLEKPAFRVLVNTQAALGAVGYTNELLPSLTLGPGTFGGSIISDNVSAQHLINIKRLAFETRPINPPEKFLHPSGRITLGSTPAPSIRGVDGGGRASHIASWIEEIDERIRLKAGNMPVTLKEPEPKHVTPTPAPVRVEKKKEEPSTKPEVPPSGFGVGITSDEIDRIMREFERR
ncbi:MAG: aldehyde dehydrogenase family protein [Ignavibacteria bacterium]|nr:aldehyde dehydrogenase family protein [Ignavibacteria bacterium]